MKTKILLVLLFTLNILSAQHEADNWYFGAFAGLNFSSGSPVAINGGRLDTYEGCSTISDRYGNLLFYTDGLTVFDRNHDVMQNGTGLKGDPSSTQSAVVIPKPAVPGVYYIFTVAAYADDPGLNYSTVDMALNGGLGGVISSEKNIQLVANTHEKITAVEHADGNSLWVITYKPGSFYAYKVSAAGVDVTPVVSSGGIYNTSAQYPYHGYLKASPDGSQLACAHQGDGRFLLYDFDNSSGIVSNTLILPLDSNEGPYGVEFSKNGSRLYVSATQNVNTQNASYTSHLYQYDLTAVNIASSRQLISTDPVYRGSLQLAVDGKIYRAISKDYNDRTYHTLGVINSPDLLGAVCNYQNSVVSLGSGISKQGLPPFITSFFNAAIRFENICVGDATHFWINTIESIDSVVWNFGDGTTSTDLEPLHTYAVGGTYTVTAAVTVAGQVHNYTKDVFISDIPVATQPNDLNACGNGDGTANFDLSQQDVAILNGQSNLVVYYYTNLVDANNNEHALESTNYLGVEGETIYAGLTNEYGCSDITNFQLNIIPTPDRNGLSNIEGLAIDGNHAIFDFNTTTTAEVIGGQTDIVVSYFDSYAAAFDGTNPLLMPYTNISNPQTIYVRSENIVSGCFIVLEFQVFLKSIFPPFFTPNTDGYNDTWNAVLGYLPTGSKVYIYDRYGKLLHTMSELQAWNGKYRAIDMPATDYWFKVKLPSGEEVRGHFALKR